jgi:periplasmic divalent cation tolerance protein
MQKPRSSKESLIVVMVTCPDSNTAEKIALSLTKKKLAACVNIISGIKSIYRWRGKVEEASEHLMIIKSKKPLLTKIIQEVRLNHPCQVPEIISFPIAGGLQEYLQWLAKETGE